MLCRSLLLVTWSTLSLLTLQAAQPPKEGEPVQWPGAKFGGGVLLPNGWSLQPIGRQTALGDFPVNIALHPTGKYLAILHAGYGDHEIVIVDAKSAKKLSRVIIDQTFYGLTFSPDGKRLFASGGEFEVVHAYDFDDGLLSKHHKIEIAKITDKFMPSGMVVNQAGNRLYVAGLLGDQLATISLDKKNEKQILDLGEASFPYGVTLSPDQKTLFVSKWGKAEVAIVDVATNKVIDTLNTSDHPTEMAVTPDGSRLFVACSNSTQVTVHDLKTKKPLETLSAALYPMPKVGNTPNSLSMTPDGQLLFVANADANNVAVFNIAEAGETKPLGFIPVGWYPTSVRYNPGDKKVYVANGKGGSSFANPQGPMPLPGLNSKSPTTQYIGSLMRGTLSTFDLPTPAKMGEEVNQPIENNPIPAKLGEKSPIKYCIYIIKENRTYDQIFGDMAPRKGNGALNLCLFPENVTPNHHKLADIFGLFDNFYVESEVSADGHEWSMAAYATDYVEKLWPLNYRGSPQKKIGYPAEGANVQIAPSAGGYIWDRCKEAGVSYRSYGEFVVNGLTANVPATTKFKNLEGHFDPMYRSFDMDYTDQKRADRFIAELQRMEKEDDMPRFQVMRLPNDHTSGTRVGKPSPTAQVADNDLALGRVVEAISKSKFWKETAIFVVEDDAQNGSDHVDAHRSVGMVISPYTKRNQVDSTMYSTSSMLRSMELILGLKPMSQFDAAARPMYNAFTMKADFTPYTHLPANINLNEKNRPDAFGAAFSEKINLAKEDQADDLLFNEIIWKSVKGKNSPMPPPVRAAFVIPKD
jgi:YVTN family beta-propeller protein